jgi:hypothetical protein
VRDRFSRSWRRLFTASTFMPADDDGPPPVLDALLLETGDTLLLENDDRVLLEV